LNGIGEQSVLPENVDLMRYKSDRVLRLTASCVQSIVRVRYRYEMPMTEAIDLARIHDVRSAVRAFGEKLELFQSVPQAARFKLAATEATFTGSVVPPADYVDHTIAVRRASIGVPSEREQNGVPREIFIANLRQLRREWEQWAREFADFMDCIASLHLEGDRGLKLLRLEPETAKRAEAELEHVLLIALRKAGELGTHVQAAA
jgi:hypothetical protein